MRFRIDAPSVLAIAGTFFSPLLPSAAHAAKSDLTFGYVSPTPECGATFHLVPGQTLEFDVKVVDTDPTHDIAWVAHDQPAGSSFTPGGPLVVFGNGVDSPTITTHFKWTPTPAQTGTFQVIWETANFPDAIRLVCGVQIEVAAVPGYGYVPPTPACGSVLHVTAGQTIEFDIKLVDPDPTHVIALAAIDQPAGSTFTPPLPIVVFGNGIDPPTITTHFSWTPAPDQTGSFQVIWDAANFPPSIRIFCNVTIVVEPPGTFHYVPPTPDCGSTIHVAAGETVDFDIKLTDSDPTHVIALDVIEQPSGSTFTPPLPIVVFGNGVDAPTITTHFSWTPAPDQTGTFQVIWDAANFPPSIRLFCSVTIEVSPPSASHFCSFTQGGWGASPSGDNAGMLLRNNFASVYPSGVEIGIAGAGGNSAKFTSSDAIEHFLPAGGMPGVLSSDFTNPTGSTGAGSFAGQVLALQINVDFSAADLPANSAGPLGSLKIKGTGIPGLDGQTVDQFLAAANSTLGGGGPSYGLSTSDLNDLAKKLNEAFDNCHASAWARAHLE